MLHEFLVSDRESILARVCSKMDKRAIAPGPGSELEPGIPLFLTQLTDTLRREQDTSARVPGTEIGEGARDHGDAARRRGLTVGELVHDYGDVCQSVTGLALEHGIEISTDEFRTLNRCLDDATARAVTEFTRPPRTGPRRRGAFAHELRGLLSTAAVSYEILKGGTVGIGGSTGALLGRTLAKLRDVVDRSLAELGHEAQGQDREHVALADLVEEVEISGMVQAMLARRTLTVAPTEAGVALDVDRQLLTAVLDTLLRNAFRFSRPTGHVVLRADTASLPGRVLIDVEDECGGLPTGRAEDLFDALPEGRDGRGRGLALAVARESVELNGGTLGVRDLPGHGCVFTVSLPRVPA